MLVQCWWGRERVQSLGKTVWRFIAKVNVLSPHKIVSLGIYLNKFKTHIHTETCTQMFTAAVFIIAKTQKQPRCPLVGDV